MTRRHMTWCCVGILAAAWACLPAPVFAQNTSALGWLAGCWATPGAEAGNGEVWTAPAGGTLFGISRTVKGGKTAAWEYLQIRDEADGTYLIAQPSGQDEGRFKALTVTKTRVVFENPAHDFPQRVIYERRDDGSVLGRIEGKRNGKAAVVDFPLVSAPCR